MFVCVDAEVLDELHSKRDSHVVDTTLDQLTEMGVELWNDHELVMDEELRGLCIVLVFLATLDQTSETRQQAIISPSMTLNWEAQIICMPDELKWQKNWMPDELERQKIWMPDELEDKRFECPMN